MSAAGRRPWHGKGKAGFRGGRALRLKPGERTKLEAEREALLQRRLAAGQILDYGFQRVTFKLADGTRYTPDFDVLYPDGRWVLEDVKGAKKEKKKASPDATVATPTGRTIPWIEEDAKVKLRVVASLFPFEFRAVWFERATKAWRYLTFDGWTEPANEEAVDEPPVANQGAATPPPAAAAPAPRDLFTGAADAHPA